MPLSTDCHPQNVKINIVKGDQVLIVYENVVPNVGSLYAAVHSKESDIKYAPGIQYCIARPFDKSDEAKRIYGRLIKCKHPNILHPLGIWLCEPKVEWKPKTEQKGEGKDKDKVIEAFITFPLIDGALMDVPKEHIFLVEPIFPVKKKGIEFATYGFTSQGSRIFCDILGAVNHINGLYKHTASGESSSAGIKEPFSLCSLKFNPRIIYMKLTEGEYKVLLWADFFTEYQERAKYRREPRVEEIWSANWNIVATYLETLWKTFKLEPNEELKQLVIMLSSKILKGEETLRYNNLLWEPGLWTAYTKIHFIREVFWSFNKETTREALLKSKTSLGLKKVISSLGFSNADNDLYDSIMFLRKKIVAHQDSAYENYNGKKADVGIDKTTIETFVQKINPEYMIKLVKEIRQLNWIEDSPLLRSETTYMEPFKPK